jgi:hypothetical protein
VVNHFQIAANPDQAQVFLLADVPVVALQGVVTTVAGLISSLEVSACPYV